MPGFLAKPDVIITTSESLVSSYELVPITCDDTPVTDSICVISKALPCGRPSTISSKTTSQKSSSRALYAAEAPTLPAPIIEIFGLELN